MSAYTVRWTEKHTVWHVEADSENEAIVNALQADNSYHSSGGFIAVLEGSDDDVD